MIKYRNGDLLAQRDVGVIIHQTDCFHTMGAGMAKQIAAKYPVALVADKATPYGDKNKLGTYSWCRLHDDRIIVNMYSQYRFGGANETRLDAMETALLKIAAQFGKHLRLGIPHGIGCGLAGGNWDDVHGLLQRLFANDDRIELVICEYRA